jgi:hypothetical protein
VILERKPCMLFPYGALEGGWGGVLIEICL